MKKAIFMGFMFFLFFSAFSQENLEYQIPPEEIPEGPDVPVPLSVKKEVEGNNKKCLEKEIYREMNTSPDRNVCEKRK